MHWSAKLQGPIPAGGWAAHDADRAARRDAPPVVASKPFVRSADALLDHFRKAYGFSEKQVATLGIIRENVVYACAKLRSEQLAALPLIPYRKTSGAGRGRRDMRNPVSRMGAPRTMRYAGDVEAVEDHPLTKLLSHPNEDWTGLDHMRMTVIYGDTEGEGHWLLNRGASKTLPPQEMSLIDPRRMAVKKATKNDKFRTIAGWVKDDNTPEREEMDPAEVVWFRHPDPEDLDYGTLSPADVAKLGADSYRDAMKSNREIFSKGMRSAGMLVPGEELGVVGDTSEIERDIGRRLMGQKNNHAIPLMPANYRFERLDISPKDAEFVALLEFAIEDCARAYGVPIEMVGGTRRTYQNDAVADLAFWMRAMEPLACWYAEVLTHKLVPMFEDIDFVAFDLSGVSALQEDDTGRWGRYKVMVEMGVPVNTILQKEGLEPIDGGDVPMVAKGREPLALASQAVVADAPVDAPPSASATVGESRDLPCAVCGGPVRDLPADAALAWCSRECFGAWCLANPDERSEGVVHGRGFYVRAPSMARGSDEHVRYWGRAVDVMAPHEKRIAGVAQRLLERQAVSIRTQIGDGKALDLAGLAAIFQRARWVKEFRSAMEPELRRVAESGAKAVESDVGRSVRFDPSDKKAVNWLRKRAQRFAQETNDTTWHGIRVALEAGMEAGDGAEDLAARITSRLDVTEGRALTIARTETVASYNMGGLLTVEQMAADTGMDMEKEWVSSLDDRVREDHEDAHGQTVALDEDFDVGGCSGPAPGETGCADQDVNCRCVLKYGRAGRARILTMTSAAMAGVN